MTVSPAPAPVGLSILIVNWNGGEVLLECLASIFAHPCSRTYEVLIFDNASTDGSPEQAGRRFPRVRLLRSGSNLGFAAANNRLMQAAAGAYFLLLNNDAVLTPGALEGLVRELEAHPAAGAVGPKLLNPDGSLQPSCGIFPTLVTEFLDNTLLYRLFPLYKGAPRAYRHPREVSWTTGACLLVRRRVFETTGGFDEAYFMFLEDVDWCWRMRQSGWSVRYTPAARVIHRKGYSSREVLPQMLIEDQRSAYRFFRLHRGAFQVQVERLIVSLGCLVRTAAWLAPALFSLRPKRRSQARRRIGAYARILRLTWTARAFVWGQAA